MSQPRLRRFEGERLRSVLDEIDFSLADLVRAFHLYGASTISAPVVSRWVHNVRTPQTEYMDMICQITGRPLDAFMVDKE